MEQRIEFGTTADATHVVQRVTLGPVQTILLIPVERVAMVQAALTEAAALASVQIVVPGNKGLIFPGDSVLPQPIEEKIARHPRSAPLERDEKCAGDSKPDRN